MRVRKRVEIVEEIVLVLISRMSSSSPRSFDSLSTDVFEWMVQENFGRGKRAFGFLPVELLVLQFVSRRFHTAVNRGGSRTAQTLLDHRNTAPERRDDALREVLQNACQTAS